MMKMKNRQSIYLFSFLVFVLSSAMTCTQMADYEKEGRNDHEAVTFYNHSSSNVWIEWNPYYPMSAEDSLFSGFQVIVRETFPIYPSRNLYWGNELKKVPFIRLMVFDALYTSESEHPDSLRKFQDEHLLYMHWYTKKGVG